MIACPLSLLFVVAAKPKKKKREGGEVRDGRVKARKRYKIEIVLLRRERRRVISMNKSPASSSFCKVAMKFLSSSESSNDMGEGEGESVVAEEEAG